MRRRKAEFDQLDTRIVLVGLGTAAETESFKARFDVPFPMIPDPDKELFRIFGLPRASTQSLLSIGMLKRGFSAMSKGHHIGKPVGDVRQLPGVFVFDTNGVVRFQHYARTPDDHPSVDDLLKALHDVGAP